MVNISELPRDPQDAFRTVLTNALEISLNFPTANLEPQIRIKAVAHIRALQAISRRLPNPEDYQEPLGRALTTTNNSNPSGTKNILASIEEVYFANTLDDHFIDPEEESQFNDLDWKSDDRDQVLTYLTDARKVISNSSSFDDNHTRRMLYWISKAENEAFKMNGKFANFLAATSEVLTLVDEAGEKGGKLASLVEKVRTTTRRNVSVSQIEMDEKPKLIESTKD